MARYILIDNASGFIFGDTADINGAILAVDTPIDACRALDEQVVHEHGRAYEEASSLASNESGYLVYRADVAGSEAVPVVHDGQDQDIIDGVQQNCLLVAMVRVAGPHAEWH